MSMHLAGASLPYGENVKNERRATGAKRRGIPESRAVTRCYTDAFGLTLLRSTRFRLAHKLPLKAFRARFGCAQAEKQAVDQS
ncbi:hypothetical protein [Burkholderia oklahomensis]|uniref:hypothetical protein n=1 Tax=Burkholderia oklahomensis TaxID=342113 RepID=UPI002659CDFF|nr:hypothetical protein [Burkholderia oklahomensis]